VKLSAPSILTAEDYAKLLGVASVELTEGEISVEITPTTKAHKCDRC
jgi:DNA-directed RNA polymerase subunit K/omega